MGWGSQSTLADGQPGCLAGTYYPAPVAAGVHSLDTGSLYYHQSGNNKALRIGGEPSRSREAGVFHSTTAAEITELGHGTGTAYCGLVVESHQPRLGTDYYLLSTGIGQYETVRGRDTPDPECKANYSTDVQYACCTMDDYGRLCPRGWGNFGTYENYEPGCYYGTYYPNPTPASNTNAYTGSLAVESENQYCNRACFHRDQQIHRA